jgi:hypothetical protein
MTCEKVSLSNYEMYPLKIEEFRRDAGVFRQQYSRKEQHRLLAKLRDGFYRPLLAAKVALKLIFFFKNFHSRIPECMPIRSLSVSFGRCRMRKR